jgi:hypothetical protein
MPDILAFGLMVMKKKIFEKLHFEDTFLGLTAVLCNRPEPFEQLW